MACHPPACVLRCTVLPCSCFVQVVEAFDVLSDEGQRAVYDKCRDYMVGIPARQPAWDTCLPHGMEPWRAAAAPAAPDTALALPCMRLCARRTPTRGAACRC